MDFQIPSSNFQKPEQDNQKNQTGSADFEVSFIDPEEVIQCWNYFDRQIPFQTFCEIF